LHDAVRDERRDAVHQSDQSAGVFRDRSSGDLDAGEGHRSPIQRSLRRCEDGRRVRRGGGTAFAKPRSAADRARDRQGQRKQLGIDRAENAGLDQRGNRTPRPTIDREDQAHRHERSGDADLSVSGNAGIVTERVVSSPEKKRGVVMEDKIVIIGAGPTGLGAAYRLRELGYKNFQMYERLDHLGGLASSYTDSAGFTWDVGGHVMFSHYKYYDECFDDLMGKDFQMNMRECWVRMFDTWVP